ncbi:BTB/POZ protein [Ochromonadaceae sp. CCMP2298]|nr:BTB/POZ protein [Ochromonadaceae sp. CCMP2298]
MEGFGVSVGSKDTSGIQDRGIKSSQEDASTPMAKRPRSDHYQDLQQEHEGKEAAFNRAADGLKEQSRALLKSAKQQAESILAEAATVKAVTEKWADDKKAEIVTWQAERRAEWEAEKETFATVQFEPIVKLNIGSVRFETSLTSLCRFPDSMIGCMFSGRHALPKGEDGHFFIDRDGTHFRHILNFLRSPEDYRSPEVELAAERELRRECKYYGLDQLMFPAIHNSSADNHFNSTGLGKRKAAKSEDSSSDSSEDSNDSSSGSDTSKEEGDHEEKEAAFGRAAEICNKDSRAMAKSAEKLLAAARSKTAEIERWEASRRAEIEKYDGMRRAEGERRAAEKRTEWEAEKAVDKKAAIKVWQAEQKAEWEAEKETFSHVQKFLPIVKLDVGGVRVTTSRATLCRFPDSMIGCMFSGRHTLPQGEDGYFFIDRDGTHFRHILNFLRSPEDFQVVVTGADEQELRRECKYYGIDQLMFPAFPNLNAAQQRSPQFSHFDLGSISPFDNFG